jgi:hypothetical protein
MIAAVIFAAICILALGTSLFAQTGSENPKKEHTKTITLKIVEDENGKVTKIDTTFIYEGDDPSSQFFYWNDDKNLQYNLSKLDSMNFKFDFETNSLDSLERSKFFIQSDNEEEMKGIEEEMRKFQEFTFNIQDSLEADGMKRIWVTVDHDSNDSIIEKNIKIIKGGKDRVIVVGRPDTIITRDGQKIMVTTDVDDEDGQTMKTVTVTTDASGNQEKTITVTVDGEDVDVQNIEEGKKIIIVRTKVNIDETEDATKEELKSAGIKEKNGDLEVENLKFSPNPGNGKFNLSFSVKEKKKVTINIYNIKGNLVYSETLKDLEGTYNKEIDISDEESGTYFIQIIQGIYDIIQKIIIQ